MHRHPRSIALGALAIFLLPRVVTAQELRCGDTLRRTIEQKFDFVSFNAKQGEVVSISVAPVAEPPQDPNFAPEFQLEDPDGDIVFLAGASRLRVCESAVHQCETTVLPLDGTYTLIVNDNGKKQTGTYTVSLEAVSQTADGAWNGPPTASAPVAPACKRTNASGKADGTQAIDFDTPVGGVIDDLGETDTFTFEAAAGETMAVELNRLAAGDLFHPRWKLFDPSGQPVEGDCDADETCSRGPLAAAGVYTIKVFERDYSATGEYTVTLRNAAATTTTTTSSTTTSTSAASSTTSTTLPLVEGDPLYELSRTLRRTPVALLAENLGTAIAATQDLLVIGSPKNQENGRGAGAVFVESLAGVPPQASYGRLLRTLYRPGGSGEDDAFGAAVALLGGTTLGDTTIVASAPGADVRAPGGTVETAGAVHLFMPDGASVEVTQPQPTRNSEFGAALATRGGELFVGAPGQGDIGRVYLVVGGGVTQEFDPAQAGSESLAAPRMADRFGAAIAAAGDLLAIGAPATSTSREGRVYLFDRLSGAWRVLRSPSAAPRDEFGAALTFVDGTLVIGAPGAGRVFKMRDQDVVEFGPAGFERLGGSLAPVAGDVLVGAPAAGDFAAAGGVVLRLDLDGIRIATYRKPVPEDDDGYGTAVVATDTHVLIGVPGDDSGSVDGGGVYAYRFDLTVEEAIFRKRVDDAAFGAAVVADDDTIAIGAPGEQNEKGAVYSFDAQPTPCGTLCVPLGMVTGGAEGSRFGQAVALVDSAMLIGAPFEDVQSTEDAGAAYLAVLGQAGRPTIANPATPPVAGDQFGFSVTVAGTDLLIGAPLLGGTDTGAVFVYTASDRRQPRLTLRNPVPTTGDFFGAAIAAEGDTVAVGAPFDSTGAAKAGAVYLFRRTTGELLAGKPLVSPEARERELFGAAVAISPELIVVGAPSEAPEEPGRAYVFDRESRGLLRTIDNPNRPGRGDRFGAAVAIVEGRVLVGAPFTDSSEADTGVAYLFDPGTGLRAQTFENPERGAHDHFGATLATAPAGLLISAPGPGRVFVYRSIAESSLVVRNALVAAAAAAEPRCGDGNVDPGEQCDDGNDIDTDNCSNDCMKPCCLIDPQAADRCNDFDPCTDDSLDVATGLCANVDDGQCCTSDASCAGQDDVCRLCAGCSLYAWDCCDQGTTCLLRSEQCQGLDCFDLSLCECQGGLTCDDSATPPDTMTQPFLTACAALAQGQNAAGADNPFAAARTSTKEARQALKAARRATRQAYKDGSFSKQCRGQYLDTINLVKRSIRGGSKLRRCVRDQLPPGGDQS